MENVPERRTSRRFTMALPLMVRANGPEGATEKRGKTRDVSFRGLYFTTDASYEPGSEIEFVLTLPKEITMAGDVKIHCYGHVVRVEPHDGTRGVAARIERYEFLSASA
jgi:PilZ domain